MAKIQEYLPESDAQGPVGQTSPLLEQVGMYGRGMETFGRELGDALTVVRQRDTAAETSDAYASVAEQRAGMMQRIQDETNAGTLDDKGLAKIKDDYQQWAEKQSDTYNTPGAKDAFVRSSARAGGSILVNAAHGSALVAGNKAKENLNTVMNQNSNMVMQDPSQFDNLRDSQKEMIQSQIDSKALTPEDARKVETAMDLELAKAATRGHMQSDYANIKAAVMANGGKDGVDIDKPDFNHSKIWLDQEGVSGILDSTSKHQLEQEIKSNTVAAMVAGKQELSVKQAAIDAQGEKFKVNSYEKLLNNSLSPDDVTKAARAGIITPEEQLKMYHLVTEAGKAQSTTNPALKNQIMNRVLLPDNDPNHISDPMQVANMVQSGMLTHKDFQDISKAIQMVPANRVNSFNESQLMKVAKQRIGTGDPDSEYKLMLFQNEVQQAKQNASANKKPIGELFDPHSANFMGNQVQKYVSSPQDILRAQAEKARGAFVSPAPVDAQIGVTPSSNVPPAQKPEDIAGLDLAGLKKLNPASLNPAQKAAAKARWNALKGKKGNP